MSSPADKPPRPLASFEVDELVDLTLTAVNQPPEQRRAVPPPVKDRPLYSCEADELVELTLPAQSPGSREGSGAQGLGVGSSPPPA